MPLDIFYDISTAEKFSQLIPIRSRRDTDFYDIYETYDYTYEYDQIETLNDRDRGLESEVVSIGLEFPCTPHISQSNSKYLFDI